MSNNLLKQVSDKFREQEDLPILSIDESREYTERLKKESEGITKMTILILSTKPQRFALNVLCQEFNRQIEMFGFKGKGVEKWNVKIPKLGEDGIQLVSEEGHPIFGLASASFKHPDKVEWVYDESDLPMEEKRSALISKSKSSDCVFYEVGEMPDKEFIKYIVND